MKKIMFFSVTILFLVTGMIAQTPNQFKYQAILRNADGTVIANEDVTVDIKILQGTITGPSVFTEVHNITTTAQGLINLNIGSLQDLSIVDWSASTYFIEISVNGSIMGTNQLLSVPYAMHARTAEAIDYSNVTNSPSIPEDISELTDNNNILFDGQWNSLTGAVPNVSIFNNDAGYLTNEVDGSVTNEKISKVVLDGTILRITEGGVTYSVDLKPLEDNAYNKGYTDGYEDGYDDGFSDGYDYASKSK